MPKQKKQSKPSKIDKGMNKGRSVYHNIGKGRIWGKDENDPYYIEDIESER